LLGRMALTFEATAQPFAKLSSPLRVILLSTMPKVIRQFQTLIWRQVVHRALEFRNAHALNYDPSKSHFNT